MRANRMSNKYDQGVDNFLEFAEKNFEDPNAMWCPCVKCCNKEAHTNEEIKGHLYF